MGTTHGKGWLPDEVWRKEIFKGQLCMHASTAYRVSMTSKRRWSNFQKCWSELDFSKDDAHRLRDSDLARLPRHLAILSMPHATNVTDAGIAGLPNGLIYINLDYAPRLTRACTANLPRSLQILYMKGVQIDASMLPRSLTDLDIDFSEPLGASQGQGQALPPGVTTLRLFRCTNVSRALVVSLPPSLQHLCLYDVRRICVGKADFPIGLKSLHLGCTGPRPPTEQLKVYNLFRRLPKTLCELQLFHALTADWSIRHLPEGLRVFGTPGSHLTDACAAHWPPRLEELYLWDAASLTDAFIERLPSRLRVFSAGSTRITDAGVALLPRHLQVLSLLNARLLTGACIPLLPRTLTALAVPNLFIAAVSRPANSTWVCLNGYEPSPELVHLQDIPHLPPALISEARRIVENRPTTNA